MLAIKYVLLSGALSMFIAAAVVLASDARKVMLHPDTSTIRWRRFSRYVVIAVLLLLPGLSIVVVPSGMAGVRVSQLSGTDRKSTRLNSSHSQISYAVFCLK